MNDTPGTAVPTMPAATDTRHEVRHDLRNVAIARALANRPKLLLADEPTGQLDSETGQRIMLLIRTVVRAEGVTAIVATHDPIMLEVADRAIELLDGHLVAPGASTGSEGTPSARP